MLFVCVWKKHLLIMVIIVSIVLSNFVLQIVQFVQGGVTVTNQMHLVSFSETGYRLSCLIPTVMTEIFVAFLIYFRQSQG